MENGRILLDLHRAPMMRQRPSHPVSTVQMAHCRSCPAALYALPGRGSDRNRNNCEPQACERDVRRVVVTAERLLTPMLVSVRGRHHIDRKQSYVIVSNHLSHYDIFVLYGWLGIDFKWVMKKELRNLPALGACLRKDGAYLHRSFKRAGRHRLSRGGERRRS